MTSLDRFAYGRPDPQAKEPEWLCTCACGCGEDIHAGDTVIEFVGELYYSADCLARAIGAEEIQAGT